MYAQNEENIFFLLEAVQLSLRRVGWSDQAVRTEWSRSVVSGLFVGCEGDCTGWKFNYVAKESSPTSKRVMIGLVFRGAPTMAFGEHNSSTSVPIQTILEIISQYQGRPLEFSNGLRFPVYECEATASIPTSGIRDCAIRIKDIGFRGIGFEIDTRVQEDGELILKCKFPNICPQTWICRVKRVVTLYSNTYRVDAVLIGVSPTGNPDQ